MSFIVHSQRLHIQEWDQKYDSIVIVAIRLLCSPIRDENHGDPAYCEQQQLAGRVVHKSHRFQYGFPASLADTFFVTYGSSGPGV
jgi:hypothetical protein